MPPPGCALEPKPDGLADDDKDEAEEEDAAEDDDEEDVDDGEDGDDTVAAEEEAASSQDHADDCSSLASCHLDSSSLLHLRHCLEVPTDQVPSHD